MANSVGSVSIDLEARIAKFESDLGRATRVAQQRSDEMRRTLGAVAAALGGIVSTAAVTAFVKSALDMQDAISKTAQKVGVSTETLSGWNLASQQAGVENEAFTKGLVKLAQSVGMVVQGSSQQVLAFKSIGVSVYDTNGHLKNLDTLFPEVIDKLSKFKDGTAKTAVSTQIFGRAGAELIPLINAGAKGLDEYVKMAQDFGLVVGSKSAKAAEDFNDRLEQLGFVSKGVANQLATALAPALADLANKAVAFFRGDTWKRALDSISTGATYVAQHIGDIINAVKLLGQIVVTVYVGKLLKLGTDWIGNLTAQGFAVDALGVKTQLSFAASVKNMGLLKTGFSVLTSAMVGYQIGTYLYNQFQVVRDAGAVMVGALLTGWEKIKEGAEIAAEMIKVAFGFSFLSIRGAMSDLAGAQAGLLAKLPGGELLAAPWRALSLSMKSASTETTDYGKKVAAIRAETAKNIAFIAANTASGIGAKSGPTPSIPPPKPNPKPTQDLDLLGTAAQKIATAYNALAKASSGYVNSVSNDPVRKATNAMADGVQNLAKLSAAYVKAGGDAKLADVLVGQGIEGLRDKFNFDVEQPKRELQGYTDALNDQLEALKASNDVRIRSMTLGDHEAQQMQQLADAQQEATKAITDFVQAHQLHPEAMSEDMYQKELDALKKYFEERNKLIQENQDAENAVRGSMDAGWQKGIADFIETTKNKFEQGRKFAEDFTSGFSDAFADFATGAKSAKDAFGDFADSLYREAMKMLANKAIAALLGGGDSNTGGGFGGGGTGILSSLLGMFGPGTIGAGLATGGPVMPGSIHRVLENGPELYTQGGNTYLMGGSQPGNVVPLRQGGGGGDTYVTNVNVQPTSTRSTADQMASAVARAQRLASVRNG